MKTVALLLSLLFAVPAFGQAVHTSSLEPGTSTDFTRAYRGEEEGNGALRALRRQLRAELLDAGLRGTYNRLLHLPPETARALGINPNDSQSTDPDGAVACRVTGDPFELTLGVDVSHRHGWSTEVEFDLDDRLISVEFEGQSHVKYGLSYDDGRDALQALVRLRF
jgi:hypothetical protein